MLLFPNWVTSSWRWRQHGLLKQWYPTTTQHGITTQKTSTWIFTAVKASNLTSDQMFCIRKILEKMWEYNGTLHELFTDFEKAYDSVREEVLRRIFTEFGVPLKLLRLIWMCLNETYNKVLLTYLLTIYLLTHSLHGAGLKSWLSQSLSKNILLSLWNLKVH